MFKKFGNWIGAKVIKPFFLTCQRGAIALTALLSSLIIAFIALIFIVQFTPMVETDVSSANITNNFTSSMIDMAVWILPVGGIVAVFYGIFSMFRGRNNGG